MPFMHGSLLVAPVGVVFQEQYQYMKKLALLDGCRPVTAIVIPEELRLLLGEIRTPLEVAEWERALCSHPDREFVTYLLKGMSQGFRIGIVSLPEVSEEVGVGGTRGDRRLPCKRERSREDRGPTGRGGWWGW